MAQTFHRYRAGDKPVGGYRLIRKLGEGGFGEVWQASAPGGAEVALKFIDLTGQQGFREFKSLRLVKKITHNNLTPLHGFWLKNEDGTLIDESDVTWSQLAPLVPSDPTSAPSGALATAVYAHPVELIVAMGLGKKSLYDRLRECQEEDLAGIPADELLDYMEDAAKGIDYLNRPIHDMGHGPMPIVHSDIKPHNILIVGDGAQVCDFGLAHAVEALRKTCQAPLTLAYAAPESFRGKPCDKSDQYSLAISYIELRTGCLPFDENLTGFEVMTAHVQGQLDFSRLTPAEAAVIRRATAPLPQDRWHSCREMIRELRRALQLTPGTSDEMPPVPAAPRERPDYRGTIQPPPVPPSSETSRNVAETPAERHPDIHTQTPVTPTPQIVRPAERAERIPRRPMSAGAKLFASVLLLAAIGGGFGAYHYFIAPAGDPSPPIPPPGQPPITAITPPITPPISTDPTIAIEQLIERGEYRKAMALLNDAGFPAEKVEQYKDEVGNKWRTQAETFFRKPDYRSAAQEYSALATAFANPPGIYDLKLMQARALLALKDWENARKLIVDDLPAGDPETPRNRILRLMKLVLDVEGGTNLDRVDELYAVWREHRGESASKSRASRGDIWQATKEEIAHLERARSKVIDQWLRTADTRRTKAGLEQLEKIIEMDAKNVDAWVAKADAHLELNETTKARQALEQRFALGAVPVTSMMRRRARALDAYYRLVQPDTDEKTLRETLQEMPDVLEAVKDRRLLLAKELSKLIEGRPSYLAEAVQALRRAAEAGDAETELKQEYVELLKRDILRRLQVADNLTGAAGGALLHDCESVVAANSSTPANVPDDIRACHAECLLELHLGGEKEALDGPGMSPGTTPYYHYVRAMIYSRGAADKKVLETSLKQLFATRTPPKLLLVADRSKKAFELVDEIADQVRGPLVDFDPGQLLRQPVDSGPAAREAYDVLRNAHEWDPLLLSPTSRANLAVAAAWMPDPDKDIELARELSSKLVREWRDKRSAGTVLAFALYHAFFAAHKDTQDESVESLRLEAGQRMIEMCSESRSLDQGDVVLFYERIVKPLEPLAQKHKKHEFFAAVAGLVTKFIKFNLPLGSPGNKPIAVAEKLEQLYTMAIEASDGKVGKYFKGRADARLSKPDRDYAGVLSDAKELKRLPDFAAQGYALDGHVTYLQSKEVDLATRLEMLNVALKSLRRAEELARKSGLLPREDLAQVLYFLSLAHLERGNIAPYLGRGGDPRQEFQAARDFAEEVINLGGGPNLDLQYAYEAAANAYEDLAWIAGENAADNFYNAVRHLQFSLALHRDSVRAHMALGRCYYKMVADRHVLPAKLQSSYGQVLLDARKVLNDGIALAAEAKDPEARRILPEVHLWLARVVQGSHVNELTELAEAKTRLTEKEFREADDHFTKAFALAKAVPLSPAYLPEYALAWGDHALWNPVLREDSKPDNAKAKLAASNAIYRRADQLAQLDEGKISGIDPVQEAHILKARADLFSKSPMPIVGVLESLEGQAIQVSKFPADKLSRSDVRLMEFRLSLQSQLQPHHLTKEVVASAVSDALWYSKISTARPFDKVRVLLNAMKLSQQIAPKDTIAVTVAQQVKCMQRIVDAKLADDFDISRHTEVMSRCYVGLKQAASAPDQTLLLLDVTKNYLRNALDSAKRRKRPQAEIAQLEEWLNPPPRQSPPPAR